MDKCTRQTVLEHNRRLHEAPDYAVNYDEHCGIMAHPWERRIFERDVAEIAARLGSTDNRRVLDVGCGTGSLSLLFIEHGFSVVGMDLAAAMLERLRAKAEAKGLAGRLELVQAEAEDYLQSCPEDFDAIVYSAVLHHLPDYKKTLLLSASRLKAGGLVYIVHEPSRADQVGLVARGLERVDRWLANAPGFLCRQWRDVRREGLVASLRGKVRRRAQRRASPRDGGGGPTTDPGEPVAEQVDWSMVDYHSKHGGCDEEAIAAVLRAAGLSVEIQRYDSKRHRILHFLAQLLHTKRMIRVLATRAV